MPASSLRTSGALRMRELSADARTLWRLLCGQPRGASHAANLQAFYAPQADRYDAFRARLLHGREELIAQLGVRPGSHVVELGCGTGSSLRTLGPLVGRLARFDMVDLCPALLEVARRRSAGHAPVHVIEADATTWRPGGAPDVVFMSYSLTMMPQWRAVIANAHAMLARGGRFGIVDFHLPTGGSRLGNALWRRWFAHDGVHPSREHLATLRQYFDPLDCVECRAKLPYLPAVRAPYYRFVGTKR